MKIRKTKPDKYLTNLLDYCNSQYDKEIIAIVNFGTYVWGNFDKKRSDYDTFFVVKDSKKKYISKDVRKKFPKISIAYFNTIQELKNQVTRGEWAVYYVLNNKAKILCHKKEYKSFLLWLSKHKFNTKKTLKRYAKFRSRQDMNEIKNRQGWRFTKWLYLSIMKRVFLITQSTYGKSSLNFQKDLEKNKYLFNKEEIAELYRLYKNYRSRKSTPRTKRKLIVNILKKLNIEIVSLSKLK